MATAPYTIRITPAAANLMHEHGGMIRRLDPGPHLSLIHI